MSYWNGRRIVVTGGCGLIGAPLVRMLVASGADVVVLDDFSRGQTIVAGAEYVNGDATSLTTCIRVFRGAYGLFNLAARVAGVAYNQEHHSEMFRANLLLQTVPLVAAKETEISRIVQVSTACIYSPEHNHPAKETNGFRGKPNEANYGYGMAKRVGERMALSLRIPAMVVRPSNAYGPGDYYDERSHVIAALIRKFYEGDFTVLGTGKEEREFIYTDDVAVGMIMAFKEGKIYATYNLGTNGETKITIADLAVKIKYLIHGDKTGITFDDSRGGGDPARWSDSTLAHRELAWCHQVSLDEGLPYAIEDYERRYQA